MFVDTRNRNINNYRATRDEERERATMLSQIKSNNPKLTDSMARAVLDGSLRSREQQAKAAAKVPKRSHPTNTKPREEQQVVNNSLAVQIEALLIK